MTILWSGPPTRRLLPEAALVGVVYFWNWGHHPKSTASLPARVDVELGS